MCNYRYLLIQNLEVEVWNEFRFNGPKLHVGKGKTTITVDDVCSNGGKIELDIPLTHTSIDGTVTDQVVVSLHLHLSETTKKLADSPRSTRNSLVRSVSNIPIAGLVSFVEQKLSGADA